ncbi:MAG: LamG domain-containing protein [Acidobacteria bacterium]|nr:LamG domain-containing protein [Acidobacteriota bacterium]
MNAGGGAEDLACSDSGFPHGNEARTAGAWVKTKSTTQPAFFDYGNEAPHERFTLLVSLKGKFMFASVGDDFEAATAVNNGRWHFLAATYDGRQANLYVDGNLDGSRKLNLKTTSNGSAVIGSVRGETAFFTGMINSPFISNYALSPREIRDLAKNSPRD